MNLKNPSDYTGWVFLFLIHTFIACIFKLIYKTNTILCVLFVFIVLQSCMLSSKMDKIVSKYYVQKHGLKPIDNKNNFVVNTDSLQKINGFCKSNYKSFYTVPLLVYFYSTERIKCTINPRFYVNTLITEINKLLESEANQGKLNDKTIELSFKNIPTTFNHHYTNNSFVALIFLTQLSLSFTKDELYYPQSNLKISYIIKDKGTSTIIKQGVLTEILTNANDKRYSIYKRKYFVENFVTSYDNTMQTICQSLAQQLINEL